MTHQPPCADAAASYDEDFAAVDGSALMRRLHRDAFGTDYPEEIDVFSSCSWWTLGQAIAQLRMVPDGTLVDLGCGQGGPGLWVARATRTHLVGIDFSATARALARAAAPRFLPPGRAEFRYGTLTATGLGGARADGVLSIDALPFSPDRRRTLQEIRRILKPGARAVFTCGERTGSGEGAGPSSWPRMARAAGLEVTATLTDEGRGERWTRLYALWQRHARELVADLGEAPAGRLLEEARTLGPLMRSGTVRHLLLAVRRPA
ncbi:class I SAM-dependent methyltransferase [Streptomyces albus subsp. chlorinus]|uniref:class I SAM-dependent methyltransferase n=1 Tax=Streptomyces albus TaxID=1888 RepID=UPI00156DE17F|nr:class I SAM-dependent methyltransferase [Streptomyces albus]NSC25395.1 class I SAM-dependent methyltransferase [Streptomyces albus subsp. chlorinus]